MECVDGSCEEDPTHMEYAKLLEPHIDRKLAGTIDAPQRPFDTWSIPFTRIPPRVLVLVERRRRRLLNSRLYVYVCVVYQYNM